MVCDYCGDDASHKCLKCNCLVCELGHCACPGRDDKDLGIDDDDAPEVPGDETTKRDPFDDDDDDDDADAQGDDDGPDLGAVWGGSQW
jgi:hypothetical protein